MKKSTRGFTLIELLVVIAIIGILSSVVLASLNSAREKSRDAKRVSDVKNVQLALELYFDSCGQYPASTTLSQANGCTGSVTLSDFLSAIPRDPSSGSLYRYAALGTNCTSYHIGATMEQTGHQVLSSDSDAAAGTACSGSDADFAGTDPLYDVTP